jgi:DNA repair exonuclease SbcCD ATPase subunit
MADVIYVTAQVLDKRLRTLEQGVNNIVPFTRRLPQIAAKADEALTIAQRLSGQMAKLGPLFRIVGIVANILAIVEQIAIIKTFADRIEAVDNQLDAHDAQLTKMNSLLLSARKRLSESEAKVKNLNNIAAEARSNAKKALTNLNTIQAKVTALNHDVAQLKTHSKESIGRLDLIEPKLKSLNDDLYEARVHAQRCFESAR